MITTAPALQGFRITANDRLVAPCGTTLLCKLGIGRTSLLWMLKALITQFMGFEAGDVAVRSCRCGTIRLRIWQECHGIIVFCVADPGALLEDSERLLGMIDQINAFAKIKARTASQPTSSLSRS
jgi:hypothetical protein